MAPSPPPDPAAGPTDSPDPTQDDPAPRSAASRSAASRSGDSVLDLVARRSGRSLKVHLRDAGSGDAAPVIDPKARAFQDELTKQDQGKYRILGEIARGGMGVVLRGHDLELGRDVAMKVVDAELAKRPEVVERFVEEAQIGGQLQHPGIVPVYEIGLMADERPYFTMKLIKGRTLAAMLTRRKSVEEDRGRLLSLFESVCQTMAYAHSKGVIHRDLKPANIMLGAFGEVQVVDWGLSKVLHRGGIADEVEAHDTALTVIATVRSGPRSGSESLAGNVLGTPAYMSPEQAQGEIAKLDERTDVFALGAILCEILTGAPPYVAGKGENVLRKAALAELDDARTRIEACSASDELKRLCLACLLPSRGARPSNAEELACTLHEHLAGLEEAAHRAQLAAAEERLSAERSRRHHQVTLLIAAAALLAGGGWWWVDGKRRDRLVELARGFDDVRAEVLQHERAARFEQALESARGGLRLVESGGADAELLDRAEALVETTAARWDEELERARAHARERRLLAFLDDVEMRQVDTGVAETDEDIDAQYRQAFVSFGVDLDDPELAEVLAPYRDTALGIRIAQGFDGWARVLRRMEIDRAGRAGELELLTGIGIDLDPDPLRATVRRSLVAHDAGRLLGLAAGPDLARLPPETLFLLASALGETKQEEEALRILTLGADLYPTSFRLASVAGLAHSEAENPLRAAAYLRQAVALRPDLPELHSKLSDALRDSGDNVAAIRALEAAVALAPDHEWNWFVMGLDYFLAGRFEEAIEAYGRSVAVYPNLFVAQNFLRLARVHAGRLDFEEYVAWAGEQPGVDAMRFLGAAHQLAHVPSPGLEPDPTRALELLGPWLATDVREANFWIPVAAAHVRLGDGAAAVGAAARARRYSSGEDRFTLAEILLLAACGHRLLGQDEASEALLERARRLREELAAGREEEWSRSLLARSFAHFEPIAAGR